MAEKSDNPSHTGKSSNTRYRRYYAFGDGFKYPNRTSRWAHSEDSRDENFGRRPYKRVWTNFQKDGKRKKLEVGNRLKEPDIGVTEFIGKHSGFSGLIKERYSDFHVNEIDLNGEIAKLTNTDLPPNPEDIVTVEELKTYVPDFVLSQINLLIDSEEYNESIEIDVTNMDKDERRAIHAIPKKLKNVKSQTINRNDRKIMIIAKKDKEDTDEFFKFRPDNRIDWTKYNGNYCYFVLHKVNMDTMDALNQIAMYLRIKSNFFSYSGTKDRRAWTSQWVSVKKISPSAIIRAAKAVRGAYVGNFKFAKVPLKLGMHSGNRFKIALRNVTGTEEDIEKAMTSLRDNGFINYYGLQRFGTVAAIPTHEIGKKLLQGKWHEAIELILKPRDGEQDRDLAEARIIYAATKDPFAAYSKIKRSDKIEATLLKGLQVSTDKNPQGALNSIPRNTRLMYIHSYQSFVWNHMVSRRIKEFGPHPIVGDLVYDNENSEKKCETDNTELSSQDNNEKDFVESIDENESVSFSNNVDGENEKTGVEEKPKIDTDSMRDSIQEVTDATESSLKLDDKINANINSDKNEPEDLHNIPKVKILTADDLPNYTLADVVMPQPGRKVTYPPYAKVWFDEFLAKDELTTDLKQQNKNYSLGGTYRKILQVPMNLSWKIMHYKKKYDNLINSDIDEMRNISSPKDDPEGSNKALIIEMSLKSSTYATMALREILKCDTSPQIQAAQSAASDVCLKNAEDEIVESAELGNEEVSEPQETKENSIEAEEKCEDYSSQERSAISSTTSVETEELKVVNANGVSCVENKTTILVEASKNEESIDAAIEINEAEVPIEISDKKE